MNDALLEQTDREDLAVYVVWMPQLGAEERHVADATRLMPDRRARHYWDPAEGLGRAYARVLLGTDGPPLWDIYFLFDRTARWGDAPPDPVFWSHQLVGLDPARRFDAETLAERALELLRATASAAGAVPDPNATTHAGEDGP